MTHGLRRTNEDKRKAVLTLLNDIAPGCERGKHICQNGTQCWEAWSDREIARRTGVMHDFVGRLSASLVSETSDKSSRTFTTKHGTVSTVGRRREGIQHEQS